MYGVLEIYTYVHVLMYIHIHVRTYDIVYTALISTSLSTHVQQPSSLNGLENMPQYTCMYVRTYDIMYTAFCQPVYTAAPQ